MCRSLQRLLRQLLAFICLTVTFLAFLHSSSYGAILSNIDLFNKIYQLFCLIYGNLFLSQLIYKAKNDGNVITKYLYKLLLLNKNALDKIKNAHSLHKEILSNEQNDF